MKGARALASGMLVLAAICAVPAMSAAQDAGTTTAATTTTTPTTTAPDPVQPPVDPGTIADGGHGKPADPGQIAQPAPTPAATPEPAPAPVTVTGPSGKAHTSASASVTMADFSFSPASVTVAVGDTVTWHNTGQAPHNATADDGSFKTPDLNNGQSASHTFSSAGTFSYICTIHPNMHGTVRVLSSSSGGGSGGSAGSTSSGSSGSEASAVASPDAAGNSSTLPMTGMAVGSLALVGAALLASGLIARRASDRSGRRRRLRIF